MPRSANSPEKESLEAILSAIRSGDIAAAKAAFDTFKNTFEGDAAIGSLQGLFELYAGNEHLAVEAFRSSGQSKAREVLGEMLGNHLHCRVMLGNRLRKPDKEASSTIEELGLNQSAAADVGVRLAACLIVKNESANLPKCLESLKDLVDEIVVLDTGSDDDTVEIARRFEAKTADFTWTQDFSEARNRALQMVESEWVLWIDADEVVTPESHTAIRRALVRPQFGGFAIEIVNFTEDSNEDSKYVHQPIRLFRNLPGVKFTGKIHEQIGPSLQALGLPWAYLPNAQLLHFGYRPSVMKERGKVDRTVALLLDTLREDPENGFQWFNLANAYTAANDFVEASRAAQEAAKWIQTGDDLAKLNYQLWSNALTKLSRPAEAIKVCDLADRSGAGGILNEFERANACLALGLTKEGLEAANRCLALDWPKDFTGDAGIANYKRFIVRGQLLALEGNYAEAIAMFDRALTANPTYGPAVYSRAATLEKMGRFEDALMAFQSGAQESGVASLCLKGASRICTDLGLPKQAAEFARRAWEIDATDQEAWVSWVTNAETAGDVPAILDAYDRYSAQFELTADMLVNWGRALDASGDVERATTCFREALNREPNNANAHFNYGDLMYKLEVFDEAAALYENGLRLDPANASGWFVLGNALARLGVLSGAELSYRQALTFRPDYQEAALNLETICGQAA